MTITDQERIAVPPNFDYSAFELPNNIDLSFRLMPHNSASDLPPEDDLKKMLIGYDGIVVESVLPTHMAELYSRVAQGKHKDYVHFRELIGNSTQFASWGLKLGSVLYASRLAVANVDVRIESTIYKRVEVTSKALSDSRRPNLSEQQVLRSKNLYFDYSEAKRNRDQAILANFAPRLGELAVTHRNFGSIRDNGPATLLAFYGGEHQSLVDALKHKKSMSPGVQFKVGITGDSEQDLYDESLYARFLRGFEITDDMYLHLAIRNTLAASLHTYGYVDLDRTPIADIREIIDRLDIGADYAKAVDIQAKIQSRNYEIYLPEDPAEPATLVRM